MKKFYLTRKNLIEIAIIFFFFLLFLFVLASVDANHAIFAKDNPIEVLYLSLKLPHIGAGVTGYVTALLLIVFMPLGSTLIILFRRMAKFKQEKYFSFKWISLATLVFLISLVFSLGVGVFYLFIKNVSILPLLRLLGSTLLVTAILAVFIGLFLFASISLFVNFKNIDKPYRLFNVAELEELEEQIDEKTRQEQEAQSDLAAKLGEVNLNEGGGFVSGALGAIGASNEVVSDTVKLATREKVFPGLSSLDQEYGGFVAKKRPTTKITLDKLSHEFRLYLAAEEKLYFDIKTIRAFVSSFGTSRLLILEGLSGTGKSSLPRYFAKFIESRSNFIPVQTTWRDKTSLIGYFNDFTQTFNETDFLKSLYRSTYEKDFINLMVLDEFNIARVEYYFADFLSVLEYPIEEQKIKVMQLPYDFTPPTHLRNGELKIEPNTFFVCTANKDDSTHSISDKVYDRAIVIDFDDKNEPFVAESAKKSIPIGFSEFEKLYLDAQNNKDYLLTQSDFARFKVITDFVYEELDVTFGNRIFHQIEKFVPVFVASGGTKEEALDFLFARKILVKVQGRFEDYIKHALINLEKLIKKQYGSKSFKDSLHLIASMTKRL